MKKVRFRLDQRLVELNLAADTTQAKALLMAGEVFVNERRLTLAGSQVTAIDRIEVRSRSLPFASRGGFKLQKALDEFQISVAGLWIADIGASNGGFTDCLLQRGAAKVFAIDVGHGQLALRLCQDARVEVRDRTNARFLTPADFARPLDMITVDASFIALASLLPTLQALLQPQGRLIGLVKPQFEAVAADVGRGGVVRDARVHQQVLQDLRCRAAEMDFPMQQLTFSPIKGPAGNIEFLAAFGGNKLGTSLSPAEVDSVVGRAHRELD